MVMTDHPKRGWVAKLTDDNPHRDHWNEALKPVSDPWLETFPVADAVVWALRSHRFDGATDAQDA